MSRFLVLASVLGLLASTSWAQEGPKEKEKEKRGGDAPRGDKKKDGDGAKPEKKHACGKSRADIAAEMKKNGLDGPDLEDSVAAHFKANHPDGPCHCTCGHDREEPAGPKPPLRDGDACGKTPKQILQSSPKIDENKVAEHFKKHHPKGEACHCNCGHAKPEKGNNGVGNGEDPQPPGKAPVNDGAGDKPGAPGRKGGEKR
jgi:hypothetical protein